MRGVNIFITLVIEFGTYTSSCDITIITELPACVKNNFKYFPDVPVKGDMNKDVGSGCLQRMQAGDENQ